MSPTSGWTLVIDKPTGAAVLSLAGRSLKIDLPVRTLEAQFQHEDAFLLLLTTDTPFEESLYAVLVGGSGDVTDTVELSNPYTPGLLQGIRISDSQSVEFEFFGQDRWRLTILEKPKRHLFQLPSSPVKYKPALGLHLLELSQVQSHG